MGATPDKVGVKSLQDVRKRSGSCILELSGMQTRIFRGTLRLQWALEDRRQKSFSVLPVLRREPERLRRNRNQKPKPKWRCQMKIFISQPMRGWTDEQIQQVRQAVRKRLRREYGEDVQFQPVVAYEKTENPAFFLGSAISQLAHCDAAYFATGWEEARGCKIEHDVCTEYGIKIIHD